MSDLPRYRVTSQDGAPARFDESETGYWTPWYIAERRCNGLRAKLEQAEARVAELEAEALYLRARDDALVDFLCNESGVDLVSVKAACGHIPIEDAWLLRKQAEAVEAFVEPYYRTPFTRGIVMDGQEYAQRLRQQADEAERAGGEQ
jgi:hypothetical protein